MEFNCVSHDRVTHFRPIAPFLVLTLLINPFALAAQPGQAQPSSTSPAAAHPADDNAPVPPMPPLDPSQLDPSEAASPAVDSFPDSPGAVESRPTAKSTGSAFTQSSPSTPQTQSAPSPSAPKEPLGTAAAETVPTVGVAASRPAGAALAPGKQRRIRTILIRTGALVGAAAALGVTMALTEGSPSKPPGAH